MKPNKFWELVEEHPWLPRIIVGFWLGLKEADFYPRCIADFLAPSALQRRILYISFKPMSQIDIRLKPVEHTRDEPSQVGGVHGRKLRANGMYHAVYWHNSKVPSRVFAFSGMTDNSENHDESLGDLLVRVKREGHMIDAIVRIRWRLHIDTAALDLANLDTPEQVDSSLGDCHGYEIFLTPSVQQTLRALDES